MRGECLFAMAVFAFGLVALGVRLKEVQLDDAAEYRRDNSQQSVRTVRVAGSRGEILDRKGRVLAGNRPTLAVICRVDAFRRPGADSTAAAITAAVARAGARLGLAEGPSFRAVRRHVLQAPLMPLEVWRDVGDRTVAELCERAEEFPGFGLARGEARRYPYGRLAAHVLGYVGLSREDGEAAFAERENCGREGLERYYDSYLRGVAGEREVVVDSRGFADHARTVREPRPGPALRLTLDIDLQRAVERELASCRGACAVIDPRDGAVLALASAPGFDPNDFVPVLPASLYARYAGDPAKPLLDRAVAGQYAPGSTFKPITALAALSLGVPADLTCDCEGFYESGGMRIRCARRWGHGPLALGEALRDSCNVYFCQLAADIGTNALVTTARAFGLGRRTGVDCPLDAAGIVPDAAWKMRTYGEPWYHGDLLQMSIGQGMLLVTPLQMACVCGALGTGRLVRPRLNAALPPESRALAVAAGDLETVRAGLRAVVSPKGTGHRGAEGVRAWILGKTGTAEVGAGERRRKNTWFIAYAETCAFGAAGEIVRAKPADRATVVAVAMVIEDGLSGGGTTAPKVAAVLRHIFGRVSHG